MSTDPELSGQLQAMLAKADRSLAAARAHLESGDYDFASSRAYYGVFYCLEAAVLTRGLTFSKHSGVISAFNREFVASGAFPKDFSRRITRLFRQRQIGDYDFGTSIDAEAAAADIQQATAVADAIRQYLQEHGFL